jgi:uncharacterized protein Usg|tara:strand:- start:3771 stop:4067 length:297 start_codon:yes stop_codon:yes gene_type:complete
MYELLDKIRELLQEEIHEMPRQIFEVSVMYETPKHEIKKFDFIEYDSMPCYPRIHKFLSYLESRLELGHIRGVKVLPKINQFEDELIKKSPEISYTIH